MNYRSVELCQQFLDRWKDDIEKDRDISGIVMVDDVIELYHQVKKIEAEYAQDKAIEDRYREKADEEHGRDGECEIDDDAVVSISEDGGAYVASWVWVQGPVEGEDYSHDIRCSVCHVTFIAECEDEDCPETKDHIGTNVCQGCQDGMFCPIDGGELDGIRSRTP